MFLQNSENPGMTLVSFVLVGNNYLAWSRSIKIVSGAKFKLGFSNGKCICSSEYHPITNNRFVLIAW